MHRRLGALRDLHREPRRPAGGAAYANSRSGVVFLLRHLDIRFLLRTVSRCAALYPSRSRPPGRIVARLRQPDAFDCGRVACRNAADEIGCSEQIALLDYAARRGVFIGNIIWSYVQGEQAVPFLPVVPDAKATPAHVSDDSAKNMGWPKSPVKLFGIGTAVFAAGGLISLILDVPSFKFPVAVVGRAAFRSIWLLVAGRGRAVRFFRNAV